MDQAKRYDGLWLVNEQVDLRFSLHNFGVQIIPFKSEKEKKNHRREKRKSLVKSIHEARHSMMQIITLKQRLKERFESMSFEIA